MAGDTRMAGKVALLLWGVQTTQLLLELPWRPAVLWDRVKLTCQGSGTAGATNCYKDKQRWWQEGQDCLSVTESGIYTCDRPGTGHSPPLTVLDDLRALQVPARALLEGDTLTLRCRCRQDNHLTRVQFYREEKDLRGSLKGTKLSLSPLQLHHSGRYRCGGGGGEGRAEVLQLLLTIMEVSHLGNYGFEMHSGVRAGDNVTLRCSVQVGSAPVTWLHNGQEVAQGPLLELRDIDVGHSGPYKCVATNQLGQDGHRVFRAPSPELSLEWQQGSPPGSSRKEEGEVLYTHLVVTKREGASPRATTLQDPQVTYAELRGPHTRLREHGDIYRNVL
ncbi:low affinity immunoglobulin gamma Fc region receptor II-like [Ammospiza caudacuta]|uniref:low affinity immunoglobulin gamma Fc region receptor II-like n=1 Tax=Ammospiza caudacuta TaxID=2857398 RepID=UPI002738E3FC|nr:low affinity immunoglobulin gamma Fc region receptor II-like [Ammospiza caudacuta]